VDFVKKLSEQDHKNTRMNSTIYLRKVLVILLMAASGTAFAQKASVVKFNAVDKLLHTQSDSIQVINFWATWCAPCVKELPLFEQLSAAGGPVKVTLINLDFADKVDRVNAFMSRKNIKSKVLLLDEIDYNSWIDKVDKSWNGAIPATLVINPKTGARKFAEKEFADGKELEQMISQVR